MDPAANPRILVVDDNDDNRYTLTLYLELEGYTDIAVAEEGEQAIAQLKEKEFDLVLLDVMMPRMSGLEACRLLKGTTQAAGLFVPVVLLSGKAFDAKTKQPIAASIRYEVLPGGRDAGRAQATPAEGYTIALPAGARYGVRAEAKGYYPINSNIDLSKVDPTVAQSWSPGQGGEAAIFEQPRSLMYQWTHRLVDWARLKLWIF